MIAVVDFVEKKYQISVRQLVYLGFKDVEICLCKRKSREEMSMWIVQAVENSRNG